MEYTVMQPSLENPSSDSLVECSSRSSQQCGTSESSRDASFSYVKVYGEKKEGLQRFIIEEGFKPAIFGSYSYDPIKKIFEPHKHKRNESQIVNSLSDKSTFSGALRTKTMFTVKPTAWWARKVVKNFTKLPVNFI